MPEKGHALVLSAAWHRAGAWRCGHCRLPLLLLLLLLLLPPKAGAAAGWHCCWPLLLLLQGTARRHAVRGRELVAGPSGRGARRKREPGGTSGEAALCPVGNLHVQAKRSNSQRARLSHSKAAVPPSPFCTACTPTASPTHIV